jgi:hypothetical protein
MEYHQYEWQVQPTPENISKVLNEHPDVLDAINSNRGLHNIDSISEDNLNIFQGTAAPAFDRVGGAIQQELPLTPEELKLLGLIKEVKDR